MLCRPHAKVAGEIFQPFKKIQVKQPHAANQQKNYNGEGDRGALEWFEFHRLGLKQKTSATQGCAGFISL
jgi:hypothetical protein